MALSRAGIPHQLTELQSLMRWAVALSDLPAPATAPPASEPAPGQGEPAPFAALLGRLEALDGPVKAAVTRVAREQHGITNIAALRDPAKIQTVHALIDSMGDPA